jgi:CspA family cold shock protein
MLTGKVVRFSAAQGYGFIRDEAGGPDVFLHVECLADGQFEDDLGDGAEVTYELIDEGRGPKADNIRVLKPGRRRERVRSLAGMTGVAAVSPVSFEIRVRHLLDRHTRQAVEEIMDIARELGLAV